MSPTRKPKDEPVEQPAEDVVDDTLPAARWPESSYRLFGVSPEVVANALDPAKSYTKDEVESAIQGFMTRPVS